MEKEAAREKSPGTAFPAPRLRDTQPETLSEQRMDAERAVRRFEEANRILL